jgi:hypothetical protein
MYIFYFESYFLKFYNIIVFFFSGGDCPVDRSGGDCPGDPKCLYIYVSIDLNKYNN